MNHPPLPRPRAVLFDMDGTLTQPLLDFDRIRAELEIAPGQPILEAIAAMPDRRRASAMAILHRHEDDAAQQATLNPGCHNLLDWLGRQSIPTAIITRNSRTCAAVVVELHGLSPNVLITRDDALPFKPDPAPLLEACRRLAVQPDQAWMVGDAVFDIQAGHRAGVHTVWISHGRRLHFVPAPHRTVTSLTALKDELVACFA